MAFLFWTCWFALGVLAGVGMLLDDVKNPQSSGWILRRPPKVVPSFSPSALIIFAILFGPVTFAMVGVLAWIDFFRKTKGLPPL